MNTADENSQSDNLMNEWVMAECAVISSALSLFLHFGPCYAHQPSICFHCVLAVNMLSYALSIVMLSSRVIQENTERMMVDLRGKVIGLLDDPALEAVKVGYCKPCIVNSTTAHFTFIYWVFAFRCKQPPNIHLKCVCIPYLYYGKHLQLSRRRSSS